MSLANCVLFGGRLGSEVKFKEPTGKKKLFCSLFLIQSHRIYPTTLVTVTCTGTTAEYVKNVIKPQVGDAISVEGHLGNPAASTSREGEHNPFAIVLRASSVFLTYPGKRRESGFFSDTRDLEREELEGLGFNEEVV